MKRSTILQSGRMLLALLLLAWASTNGWGQSEVNDEFIATDFVGEPGNYVEYKDFFDVPGTSGALYEGNMACSPSSQAIQLRASSPSGIVVTKAGGDRIKRITLEWNSSTNSEREIGVFGKTSAYSSIKDLYSDGVATKGRLLGVLKKGTSVLEIDENYDFIGICSLDGTLYLDKITITWVSGEQEQIQVSAPTLSPKSGTIFTESLKVTASCSTAGAVIHYTKDGTVPTEASEVFPEGGLTIDGTTTIKAIAVLSASDGSIVRSNMVTAIYTKKSNLTFNWSATSYTVNLDEKNPAYPTLSNNSDGTVAYSSSNTSVATIDADGNIALHAEGTTTITASVEATDNYPAASDSYQLTVQDIGTLGELVAFVARKGDNYYAMATRQGNDNDEMAALQVDVLNGKVVDVSDREDDITWYLNKDEGTIRTSSGDYLQAGVTSSTTSLGLGASHYQWNWDNDLSAWVVDGNRSFIYNTAGLFKNYAVSNVTTSSEYYADTFTSSMPIVDGYTRSGLTPGNYGTICLPCAVAADDYEGVEFFTVAGGVKENGVVNSIVLEEVQTLEAGVPYIFCATGEELLVAYSGEAVESAGENNGLVGSFSGMDVAEGMYLLTADNEVKKLGEKGGHIAENRAYFNLAGMPEYAGETAGVNQRVIVLDDATGVSAVEADGEALVDVFSLGGVKVRSQVAAGRATDGLPKGIYVVNRQKVVVD